MVTDEHGERIALALGGYFEEGPIEYEWAGEKFAYKLAWMDRLIEHAAGLIGLDEPVLLGGDYNICPTDADVYDPVGWADDATVAAAYGCDRCERSRR